MKLATIGNVQEKLDRNQVYAKRGAGYVLETQKMCNKNNIKGHETNTERNVQWSSRQKSISTTKIIHDG